MVAKFFAFAICFVSAQISVDGLTREDVDALDESLVWQLQPKYTNSPLEIHNIDSAFYDAHLVSWYTGSALSPNQTWVIGVTTDTPAHLHYHHSLVAKTIFQLSDIYATSPHMRFGIVNCSAEKLLAQSLLQTNSLPPKIVMIKDGKVYEQEQG